ncbi:CFI-box-CTERM domain-containing protein [Pelosinus propionicus]|uniref:phosphodiesterase I n=1 Tax=Pelosinus propionicus DSM 13327 TaxID=1123291 RepID=A0A1I4JU39_9FIRM|nr:CFI-box-CTERM domain-containing protein [Pelosinus propionicus]SFL70069.1 VRR-NUC domain-containing protein [Pelosinus propionicus DSM 13327]
MEIINLNFEKIPSNEKGKIRYKLGNDELFPEETVIKHLVNNGYKAIWSENDYWWYLLALLFWDVIFARIQGAVTVIQHGLEIDLVPGSDDFNKYYDPTVSINGMPSDLFKTEFYPRRKALITNKIQELSHKNIEEILRKSYHLHFNTNCRLIENWSKYSVDQLAIATQLVDRDKLLCILERILNNINENRAGLPDLIIYDDKDFFFGEVKSENDKLSDKQKDWISFLESLNLTSNLYVINHSNKQIENIKNRSTAKKIFIKVSFGNSTSKKREEAIQFVKQQPTYFTSGEGKEQIYGAIFDASDIENLYQILDLTSGWKTQRIETNGEILKSTELRGVLWCFREKNRLKASSDYCKQHQYNDEKNPFNCRQISFDPKRWTQYGYIDTENGDWVFNKEELQNFINDIIARQSLCPLFDSKKIAQFLKDLPNTINPIRDKSWAYLSIDRRRWFCHNGQWIDSWGSSDGYPGARTMIGIEEISNKEIKESLQHLKLMKEFRSEITVNIESQKTRQVAKKSGCFIATTIYGDYDAPQVLTLRRFRDKILGQSVLGRIFINTYYTLSPILIKIIKTHKPVSNITRIFLERLILWLEQKHPNI